MKKIILLLTLVSFFKINAQEIKEQNIISSVSKATVFLNSAQVTRKKKVTITKGVHILKFSNLSPFIDKKSIQVKAKDIEVQSINFQKNYTQLTKKTDKQKVLEKQISSLKSQIEKETINLNITDEEIFFLKQNRDLKGEQTLTGTIIREALQYYSAQIKFLYNQQFILKNKILKLKNNSAKIQKQLNNISSVKEYPSGEIFIKIATSKAKTLPIEIIYNVANVSWYPTYDIKAKDINSPLKIIYKANVIQHSKVDWNNVQLKFSSANPSKSIKAGQLKTYFLNYGTTPPVYSNLSGEVTGIIYDMNKNPIPGVSILVKGTSIATTSDFDGKFSINVPESATELVFSYLGFKTIEKPIQKNMGNIFLEESNEALEEIVIVGYDSSRKKRKGKNLQSGKATVIRGVNGLKKETKTDYTLPTEQIINQTSVSFKIVKPYSLKSSNKDYIIPMKTYSTKANYTYNSIPKIEENAFLLASVKDWEKLNLLEGEANIYFEDTFVGTSLLDTRFTEKELDISLGIDKNVTIKRKKLNDFTTRQFIGNKKQEKRTYEIVVKNNKQQSINIVIKDQIPISKREEISVTLEESSNGKLDKKTGEIKWNLQLNPKESKTMTLKYSVRFQKGYQLNLD